MLIPCNMLAMSRSLDRVTYNNSTILEAFQILLEASSAILEAAMTLPEKISTHIRVSSTLLVLDVPRTLLEALRHK